MTAPVVRFAPSPTGYLHIGGARTALFNWLFAKHYGGDFKLRIEDTDIVRSTQDSLDVIFRDLTWLGLVWDGSVVYQSHNADRHRAVVQELLRQGKAYHDDGAIRLRSSDVQTHEVDDLVKGRVAFNRKVDDMVLLRSDGSPTYMLAVVVDDHDMGVTHVIRGDDHLNNTFRQNELYRALEWEQPAYAHLSLIHGPDGKKLSKRTGAVAVDDFRDKGYLPEALRNYILRLGWAHKDEEFIPTERAIELFTLDGCGKSASRFDYKKLDWLNRKYKRTVDA